MKVRILPRGDATIEYVKRYYMKKFESYQESFDNLKKSYETLLHNLAKIILNNPKLAVEIELDYEDGVVSSKVFYKETMAPNDGWCIYWQMKSFGIERFLKYHLELKQTLFEYEHRRLLTIFGIK